MATAPAPDDAALVARCRQGDGRAWGLLVARYERLVYAIAVRAGLDEHGAADVFQTCFERLLKALPRLEQPDRLQAWIVTTARREVGLVRMRAGRTVSMTGDDDTPDMDFEHDAPTPEQQLESLQQAVQVREAMQRLDERCRTLLALVFRDPDDALDWDEVARRTGMARGSVGPTRARCLEKLRRLCEER